MWKIRNIKILKITVQWDEIWHSEEDANFKIDTWSSETVIPLYQDCLRDRKLDYHSNFMQQSQSGDGEGRLALYSTWRFISWSGSESDWTLYWTS